MSDKISQMKESIFSMYKLLFQIENYFRVIILELLSEKKKMLERFRINSSVSDCISIEEISFSKER